MRDLRRKPAPRPDAPHETRTPPPAGDDSDRRFRRCNRLSDAADYTAVFKGARRSRDALFAVLCIPSGGSEPRLGLAVAKKHSRRATARNRIKRLIRESFRHHKHSLSGLDLVVMNTPATAAADRAAIRKSLAAHWKACARKGGSRRSPHG